MMKTKLDDLEKILAQQKRAFEIRYMATEAMRSMPAGQPTMREAQVLVGHMYIAKKDFGRAMYHIGRALEHAKYSPEKVTLIEFVMERALAGIERTIEQVMKPETKISAEGKYRVLNNAVGLIKTYYPELKTAKE